MTNKTILVALLLVTTASVVGVGGYYATDFLRDEPEIVAQPEAPDARIDSDDAQEVPPGTVNLDDLLAESAQEPAAEGEADIQAVPGLGDSEAGVADDPDGSPPTAPSFDVIRVEPSGEFMAAGRSAPNAVVEMLLGSEILASEAANNAGEWTLVPDEPLPAGRHDLVLRATGEDQGAVVGDQVAVVIEESGGRPLVAVTRPGKATEIVQRPEEVALADPDPGGTSGPGTGGEDAVPEAEIAAASTVERNDTGQATPEQIEPESQRPLSDLDSGESRDASGAGGAAARDESAPGGPIIAGAADETELESGGAGTAPVREGPAREEDMAALRETDQAAGRTVEEAGVAPVAGATLAIDAVEVEDTNRLYLSGRGAPDADVRIYVNEEHLGDVRAGADGTWSRIDERRMPPGRYTVRADLLDDEGNVEERAEVRFDRVRLATAEGTEGTGEDIAGAGRAAPESGGEELALRLVPESADAIPGSESGDRANASPGTVYIERGDNLWHIARQIYGQGTRYTVIYEANQNQIRDPDLIFPGQVFTIPLPDESGG